MLTATREQVVQALRQVGLAPGDGVLVHSALQFLGRPEGGIGMYLEAFAEVIDLPARGTLAVPTFNFAFAGGEAFDPLRTPSKGMGAFAEHVRLDPRARRTVHPMQSVAVIGRLRDDLAGRDTACAFDPGSAFARMLELDFTLLLLGANIDAASMVHYSEIRAAVPYRYWKEFRGPVIVDGAAGERTCRMFVRDMDLDPQLTLQPVEQILRQNGQWREAPLNYGQIAACRLQDLNAITEEMLRADPWALVTSTARDRPG